MAYRLVRRSHMKRGLTEEELDKHLDYPSIPGERPMEKTRLKWIDSLLKSKRFNRVDWAYCHCKEDGVDYRVNGQHTGYKLNLARKGEIEGATFPQGVPGEIQYWECDTRKELADVFDQFDSHRSVRKPKDKLGVFQAQHDDVNTVARDLASQVLAGIQWGCGRRPRITDCIAKYRAVGSYERGVMLNVDEVRKFLLFVADNQRGTFYKEWLHRPGIVAFFFEAFLEEEEKAKTLLQFLIYEVPDTPAVAFAAWTRKEAKKAGADAGKFFREADKCMSKLSRDLESRSEEDVQKMLDEAMEEEPSMFEDAST